MVYACFPSCVYLIWYHFTGTAHQNSSRMYNEQKQSYHQTQSYHCNCDAEQGLELGLCWSWAAPNSEARWAWSGWNPRMRPHDWIACSTREFVEGVYKYICICWFIDIYWLICFFICYYLLIYWLIFVCFNLFISISTTSNLTMDMCKATKPRRHSVTQKTLRLQGFSGILDHQCARNSCRPCLAGEWNRIGNKNAY